MLCDHGNIAVRFGPPSPLGGMEIMRAVLSPGANVRIKAGCHDRKALNPPPHRPSRLRSKRAGDGWIFPGLLLLEGSLHSVVKAASCCLCGSLPTRPRGSSFRNENASSCPPLLSSHQHCPQPPLHQNELGSYPAEDAEWM